MTYKFKVGDTGKTRGGESYRVIAVGLNHVRSVAAVVKRTNGLEIVGTFFPNGHSYDGGRSEFDLIPPTPAVYMNVYEQSNGGPLLSHIQHGSRHEADKSAVNARNRVGCIRVELVEGRFDD